MQWCRQLQEVSGQCVRAFEGLASSKDSQVGRGASWEFLGCPKGRWAGCHIP